MTTQNEINTQLAQTLQSMMNRSKPLLKNRDKHSHEKNNLFLNDDLKPVARFVKTSPAMTGFTRLNPYDLSVVLSGVLMTNEEGFYGKVTYGFVYDDCTVEIYSFPELEHFMQENRSIIEAGLLVRNDDISRDTVASYNYGKLVINSGEIEEGVLL